jgi:hypothetical protein
VAESAGFRQAARLPGHLRAEERERDVDVWQKRLV